MIDYKTVLSTTSSKVTLLEYLHALSQEFGNSKIDSMTFTNSGDKSLTFTFILADGTIKTATATAITLTEDEKSLISEMIKSVSATDEGVTFNQAVTLAGNAVFKGNEIHQGYESHLGDESHSGTVTYKGVIKTTEIDSTSGNAMLRDKSTEGTIVLGSSAKKAVIMGSGDRPTYSKDGSDFTGSGIALQSDLKAMDMQHVFIPPSTSPDGYFKDIDFGESATLYIHKGSNFTRVTSGTVFENCKCESVVADDMGEWIAESAGNAYIKNFEVKGTMYNFSWSAFGGWSALETFKVGSFTNLNYLYSIFYDCRKLKSVNADEWDTSNVTGMSRMFDECVSLEKVPYFNTSKVTDASGFLYVRESYTSLPITEIPAYDLSACTNLSNFVTGQVSLEHFYCTGMKVSFSLASSTKWEAGALVTVFNNLADVTSAETAPTLTLGATNLAKLTDTQKSIATAKGWNLA